MSNEPHLYPLARVLDQYPRYAVLVADTHRSRIVVVAANNVETTEQVTGTKTRRHKMGGWSQARYQRHIENYHQQHAKEVAETLTRLVRDEGIGAIVIAGDNVAVPLVRDELPKDIAARVVDVVKLDDHAPERQIVDATIESLGKRTPKPIASGWRPCSARTAQAASRRSASSRHSVRWRSARSTNF